MSTITTKDGAQICNKEYGSGLRGVFSHGWPLSSGGLEDQMLFLSTQKITYYIEKKVKQHEPST